jgi:hypothetical protein
MGEALAGAGRSTDGPLMARYHYETRRDAERQYPHRGAVGKRNRAVNAALDGDAIDVRALHLHVPP